MYREADAGPSENVDSHMLKELNGNVTTEDVTYTGTRIKDMLCEDGNGLKVACFKNCTNDSTSTELCMLRKRFICNRNGGCVGRSADETVMNSVIRKRFLCNRHGCRAFIRRRSAQTNVTNEEKEDNLLTIFKKLRRKIKSENENSDTGSNSPDYGKTKTEITESPLVGRIIPNACGKDPECFI